jgi:hypothetical protein
VHYESLPEQTRRVFDLLSAESRLSDFVLIGGTAMSLRKAHRLSEDIDLWLPFGCLNKKILSSILSDLKRTGHDVSLKTPSSMIVSAKINGHDLLSCVQDHAIDGVKVTFLAKMDTAYSYFSRFEILKRGKSFGIMSENGIFAMKAHVIHKRTKSRDLFDLAFFLRSGKSVGDIIIAGQEADPCASAEYAKSVLRGDIPLDPDDEGFFGLNVTESVADIQNFLSGKVDEYEQSIARSILKIK